MISNDAKVFAIKVHRGQRRKSDKDKPMIIHPINVANILREYNFDDNVIAAGYLHDTVEDTSTTLDDINKLFGEDIKSLVEGASEPDKSLSWEERKKHTIETIKTLDMRHKAVIAADKISNLEDLKILFEIKGEYDFSAFKRGFDDQKWYYTEVYNSLTLNDNHPMFDRLKELIDYVFYNDRKDEYLINNIFNDNLDEYKELKKLQYKLKEITKLRSYVNNKPYVIEFTGTPRTGKTTLINNLKDFFKKAGYNVKLINEFTTSKKYKEEVYPSLINKSYKELNIEIPKYIKVNLEEAIKENPDIIIVDRSLYDRLVWFDRLYQKNGLTKREFDSLFNMYMDVIEKTTNIIISTYTDPITSLKRDYMNNLSLENRSFLSEENIAEYNNALKDMEDKISNNKCNSKSFDTTSKNERIISIEVAKTILDDMKSKLIEKINNNDELLDK